MPVIFYFLNSFLNKSCHSAHNTQVGWEKIHVRIASMVSDCCKFELLQTKWIAIQIQVRRKILTGSNKDELNDTIRSELKWFECLPCLIQTDSVTVDVCCVPMCRFHFLSWLHTILKENDKKLTFLFIVLVFYCQRCGWPCICQILAVEATRCWSQTGILTLRVIQAYTEGNRMVCQDSTILFWSLEW